MKPSPGGQKPLFQSGGAYQPGLRKKGPGPLDADPSKFQKAPTKNRNLLTVDKIATQLKVRSDQVQEWVDRGLLRSSTSGIHVLDLEKFKRTHSDEIQRAQSAPAGTPAKKKKKEATGKKTSFFEAFTALLRRKKPPSTVNETPDAAGRLDFPDSTARKERIRDLEKKLADAVAMKDRKIRELEEKLVGAGGGDSGRVQEIEGRLQSTQAELAQAQEQINRLQQGGGASPEVAGQLEEARRYARYYHQESTRLQQELETSQAQFREFQAGAGASQDVGRLEQELAQAQSQVQDFRGRLQQASQLHATNQTLQRQMEQAQQRIQQLERQESQPSQAEAQLAQQVAELQKHLERAGQRVQQLEQQQSQPSQAEAQMANHIAELQQWVEKAQYRIQELEQEQSQASAGPSQPEAQMAARIDELQQQLGRAVELQSDVEERLSEQDALLYQREAQIVQLEHDLRAAQAQAGPSAGVEQFQARLEERQRHLDAATAEVQTLRTRFAQVTEQVAQRQGLIEELQAEIVAYAERVASLDEEKRELASSLQAGSQQHLIDELSQRLGQLEQQMGRPATAPGGGLSELQARIQDMKSGVADRSTGSKWALPAAATEADSSGGLGIWPAQTDTGGTLELGIWPPAGTPNEEPASWPPRSPGFAPKTSWGGLAASPPLAGPSDED